MGYASRAGRAIANPTAPRAFGVCDRCGIWYNLHRLHYQYEWQGTKLQNLRLRVCYICMDKPNVQLRARIAPPDPVPVYDPRPETFSRGIVGSGSALSTEQSPPPPFQPLITEDGTSYITIE